MFDSLCSWWWWELVGACAVASLLPCLAVAGAVWFLRGAAEAEEQDHG